jgi:pilus assembly protein CpaB
MQNRAFTMSFIVAALAVSMVYSYVSSTEESLKKQYGEERSVVVAKKDIKELDILDETNLTTKSVPKNFVQPGTVKSIEEVLGSLAVAPINKDEQITRTKVTQLGSRTGLARQVSIGKRAVTVRVGDESGVAKLIKPGDRVDVMVWADPTGSGNKINFVVHTLLQDVLVLATGRFVTNTVPGILESDPMKPELKRKVQLSEYTTFGHVTLEVDPNQAQQIVYAEKNLNGVYLALRNNDDNTKETLDKSCMDRVLGKSDRCSMDVRAPASAAPVNPSGPIVNNAGPPPPVRR